MTTKKKCVNCGTDVSVVKRRRINFCPPDFASINLAEIHGFVLHDFISWLGNAGTLSYICQTCFRKCESFENAKKRIEEIKDEVVQKSKGSESLLQRFRQQRAGNQVLVTSIANEGKHEFVSPALKRVRRQLFGDSDKNKKKPRIDCEEVKVEKSKFSPVAKVMSLYYYVLSR